jgi:aspartate aminotransferase-like enzyme
MTPGTVPASPPILMTPGPTRVPERVLRAGARPMIHHRSPEFSAELGAMLELIRPLFGTTQPVLPVHTTGRGAMEAAICNLCSVGDEIVMCCNGRFGTMWAGFAESYGVVVHRVSTDWARSVDAAEVERALAEHPRARIVGVSQCDTSTGVLNDVAAIARVARTRGALLMVDGISSIGGAPFAFDEWGVDVAVTATQKCLMSSPGLSFAVLSERAWAAVPDAKLPRNYWDFASIRASVTKAKPEPPGTAPVHLVFQVVESLRMIHEEGLANVLARHAQMAERIRRGVTELGLAMQAPMLEQYSPTVTAVALPAGVAPKPLRDAIKVRGVLTAAGMGPYEASSFRIGHMGDIRMADVELTLAAVGDALAAIRAHEPASARP